MPEIWRKTETEYTIIIWQSTEPIDDLLLNASLTDKELIEYKSFRSETRRREWLTVRNVLKFLVPNENSSIQYDSNGKPQLKGNTSISISHSDDHIALMISEGRKIGVDIEKIHERIDKLAHKFMSDEENKNLQLDVRREMLHAYWGAKEVLFKIHSIGGLDFRKELFVKAFEYSTSGCMNASIKKKSFEKDFIVYYEKIKQYMLSWAIS